MSLEEALRANTAALSEHTILLSTIEKTMNALLASQNATYVERRGRAGLAAPAQRTVAESPTFTGVLTQPLIPPAKAPAPIAENPSTTKSLEHSTHPPTPTAEAPESMAPPAVDTADVEIICADALRDLFKRLILQDEARARRVLSDLGVLKFGELKEAQYAQFHALVTAALNV